MSGLAPPDRAQRRGTCCVTACQRRSPNRWIPTHGIGDCIMVGGEASRFIEPIARQARTIAAHIADGTPLPYEARPAVVRVKTTSLPLTLRQSHHSAAG